MQEIIIGGSIRSGKTMMRTLEKLESLKLKDPLNFSFPLNIYCDNFSKIAISKNQEEIRKKYIDKITSE